MIHCPQCDSKILKPTHEPDYYFCVFCHYGWTLNQQHTINILKARIREHQKELVKNVQKVISDMPISGKTEVIGISVRFNIIPADLNSLKFRFPNARICERSFIPAECIFYMLPEDINDFISYCNFSRIQYRKGNIRFQIEQITPKV